jgi:YVTN family beta-propeller protein
VIHRQSLAAVVGGMMLVACGDTSGPGSERLLAYVSNFGSNTVSVVDAHRDSLIATVAVGAQPLAITATPDGRFVYVGNRLSEDVSVIETAGHTVVATIATGPASLGIAADPTGNFVYQALRGDREAVALIATATNTVSATVGVGGHPEYIAFMPHESRAYVAHTSGLSIIETTTQTIIGEIDLRDVMAQPLGLAFSPDNSLLYVGSYDRYGWVAVIETTGHTVVDSIVGTPYALQIAPVHDGGMAYVVLANFPIAVLDFARNELLTTVRVESWALAPIPGENLIYATSMPDSSLAVIDTRSHTVVRTVRVGATPTGIAIARIQQ